MLPVAAVGRSMRLLPAAQRCRELGARPDPTPQILADEAPAPREPQDADARLVSIPAKKR
jgi:hypothetical protein